MDTNNDETGLKSESIEILEQNEKPLNADEEFFEDSIAPQPDFDNVDAEDGGDQRFQAGNRGGFRGRWNAGAISPRFRGRGFAPNQICQPRRGNPQFFRGGRAAPPRNFQDQNWNAAPPMYVQSGHMGQFNNPVELWVEIKTEGKSYYYHAITRETTWTRPEGQFVKIMSQSEIEAMQAAKNQQQQQQQQQQQPSNQPQESAQSGAQTQSQPASAAAQDNEQKTPITNSEENSQLNRENQSMNNGDGNLASSRNETTEENAQEPQSQSQTQLQPQSQPPPMMNAVSQQPQVDLHQAPPTQMQPQFNTPPPFAYGMPPPNYMYPPNPWSMPWQPPVQQQMQNDASKSMMKPNMIDSQILARAAEWSEHRAPDGRFYYYHAIRGESVWEKPQPLKELDAARMASGQQPFPMGTNTSMMPPMVNQMQPIAASGQFDAPNFNQKPDTKPEESEEAKLEKKKKMDAERKKKEDEEKAKQAANKPQDKSRPISSTPIAGTPWCVVWTGDGRVFFYNPSSRTSVWERPDELNGRSDVDKAIATMPEQLSSAQSSATNNSTAPLKDDKQKPAQETVADDQSTASAVKRTESESSSGESETPSKKLKLADNAPADVNPVSLIKPSNDKKNDIGKENAMEAEVKAARERALVPLETRVKQFKEMLKEKDVSAFSTWEKELHKIVFDPRYLLLTSRERKQVFEKYVKERAEEERREKRNKIRQKRDEFRSLMESVNLHGKSSFSDFAQKHGKDDRFKGIEKMRDRESLFNEYILEVRRREKDEKVQKKETIRKDFLALLREYNEITRHSRWIDVKKLIDTDKRYRAVENSIQREDYFHEYCKILKEERRKQKEKERDRKDKKDKDKHRDKDRQRDKGKDGKNKDKREKRGDSKDSDKQNQSKDDKSSNIDSDKDDHEDGEHPDTDTDNESDRQQDERDRQMRAIVEREKEVQQQLAGHMRNLHKEREHHKRDEAMRHFNALLADLVRNPDLTWKEVKKQLRKDNRWESVELLDRDDRERIFNDHIIQLGKKKRDKFREMLSELPQFDLTASWKDIKRQIRDDPRYIKYNSSEKCEREFREYIRDRTTEAKVSFKELLQECKLITYKSFETVKENPLHLKEIEDILKNDKRFLTLDHIQYDRSQILMNYLEDLYKRGPPPPPTQSDSTRRK